MIKMKRKEKRRICEKMKVTDSAYFVSISEENWYDYQTIPWKNFNGDDNYVFIFNDIIYRDGNDRFPNMNDFFDNEIERFTYSNKQFITKSIQNRKFNINFYCTRRGFIFYISSPDIQCELHPSPYYTIFLDLILGRLKEIFQDDVSNIKVFARLSRDFRWKKGDPLDESLISLGKLGFKKIYYIYKEHQ